MHTVWPGEVLRPQEASPRPDFFQTYTKNIPGLGSSTVQNFIEIGPMVWISIAYIQTHTCIDFYVLDENEMN